MRRSPAKTSRVYPDVKYRNEHMQDEPDNWIRQKMNRGSSEGQNLLIWCVISWKDETETKRRRALWTSSELLLSCRSNPAEMKQQWGGGGVGGSALLFSFSFYVQTKKKSDGFFSRAFLSYAADVWGDAGGLVFVRRTPGYAWWHPGWTRASKGQRYKLFSLKFCIGVGSDGSTWEGLIHATLKAARWQRMPVEMQMNDQTGRTINSLMLTEMSLHLKYRWCTKEEASIDLGLNISQWNLHKSSR